MRRTATMSVIAAAALGITISGCAKDGAPEGMTVVALEGLPGLEAWVPNGTKVSKNAVGIGVMLAGPGVSMTVGRALDVDAATLEQAEENAQAYAATNLEPRTLPDGYILTYENVGSTGTNYWLVGRRELEGTAYSCGVSSPKKEHQQSAVAICESLKK